MSRGFVGLAMVAGCLVFGIAGWAMELPRPTSGAAGLPVSVATVPPGGYLDAAGDVVTPSAAHDSATSTSGGARPAVTIEAGWLRSTSADTGIASRALQAYASAAVRSSASDPECRLTWNTLAAIGDVESANGTYGGTHVEPDGEISAAISGPVLDGTGGTVAIRGTAKGGWSRAVGPLQMLPSTWARYGVDATGDGRKDPENIDDASLAAADYLCAAGGDLSTASGWTTAVHAYNHDDAYVAAVRKQADLYASETTG
ncbi:MAG: lytic transglycosylase protein [Frondihabitans sp.]|nr:lytic transglycosylase protein [Frondihabitans sp.]